MTFNRIIVLSFVFLIFGACSSGPATVGELKGFDAVCDKTNDGKRIAVEGYLRFPKDFTGTDSIVLRLYKAADATGTPIGVQTIVGAQANQMELPPSRYTEKDLQVHLVDGQVAGAETKVRVSGKVYYPIVGQDFTCGLENPLIESAK
jgi:hypothetical protein